MVSLVELLRLEGPSCTSGGELAVSQGDGFGGGGEPVLFNLSFLL